MNTPVNFEIGKLLRDNKQNISSSKLMYASNGKLTDAINIFDDWFFAPTIAEVLMWFYEKHGIWISCDATVNLWYYSISIPETGKMIIFTSEKSFKSPTQAYLEAIKYILINNIIKK